MCLTNSKESQIFNCIPAYAHGRKLGIYNCGAGLIRRNEEAESYMQGIADTSAEEYKEYCATLLRAGFTDVYSNEMNGNLYNGFECKDKKLYTYYVPFERTTRIILDNASDSFSHFCGSNEYIAAVKAGILQYALYYSDMIKGTTCDCGMFYAIRLKDNSLVIIDGGETEQATDVATEHIMSVLADITDAAANEKIVISAWFCSHAHDDHMDVFAKLLRVYHGRIELKRVMFNFPSPSEIVIDSCVARIKERINAYYPNVLYLKLHSGQSFALAGTQFTVLCTHEDIAPVFGRHSTLRMNATSTVLLTETDGVKFLLPGDSEEANEEILIERYTDEYLHSDFLQAAHHCINKDELMYEKVSAKEVLIPQCRKNCDTRMLENYNVIKTYTPEEHIYLAGDESLFFTIDNGRYKLEKKYPLTGMPYDGSEV